jgi:hydrogenase maturation protease
MKTLIIGLGNPYLTDDGIGVKVANAIEKELKPGTHKELTIEEASVGGLRLMEAMIGFDRVILIDALITHNENKPGTIKRMTLDDLNSISPTQHSACAHDTTLVTALEMGRRLGLDLPSEIIIYAIEVSNVMDFSEHSTPAVTMAIPHVVSSVIREIQSQKV